MGSFYTNITLRTTDTERVAATLRKARRVALVAPPHHGSTVVFDAQSEEQDLEVLRALAGELSRTCKCPALAVVNHDDDVLYYWLYDGGSVVDEYDSAPSYFDDSLDPDTPPSGGDAQRLSAAFGAEAHLADIERVLRAPTGTDEGFTFATDRHSELARVIGISSFAVGTGYTYLEQGEFPEGLEPPSLRRV